MRLGIAEEHQVVQDELSGRHRHRHRHENADGVGGRRGMRMRIDVVEMDRRQSPWRDVQSVVANQHGRRGLSWGGEVLEINPVTVSRMESDGKIWGV